MRAFQNELHKNDPHTNAMEVFLVYPNDFLRMTFSSSPQNIAAVRTIGQWYRSIFLIVFNCLRTLGIIPGFFPALVSGVCFRCVKRNPQELLDAYYRDLKEIGLARDKLQQGSA
jgi:hypothetical protein